MSIASDELIERLREFGDLAYESGIFNDKTVCADAADLITRLTTEKAGVDELREALRFYATEWHADLDAQGYPNTALFNDKGERARAALQNASTP